MDEALTEQESEFCVNDLKRVLSEMDINRNESVETFQQVLKISDACMNCFYKIAYYLANERKLFHEAIEILNFLLILNHTHKHYWLALGYAQKETKDYEKALESYALAFVMDLKDPLPRFHAI